MGEAYGGKGLADWCEQQRGWKVEVVKRSGGSCGIEVLPRRWVEERTFSWLGRQRRLSNDYEQGPDQRDLYPSCHDPLNASPAGNKRRVICQTLTQPAVTSNGSSPDC
jgi:putative transposase